MLKKILFIVLFIFALFLIIQAYLYVRGQIADSNESDEVSTEDNSSSDTQTDDGLDYKKICEEDLDGKWLAEYMECEGISEYHCQTFHGKYDDCASACRHMEGQQACIDLCVEVCDLSE